MPRLVNVLVLAGTVLAILVAGEIVVRARVGDDDDSPLYAARTDPFVITLLPNVMVRRAGVEVRTNALGFRDDPVAMPKPQGVTRILCVGDSFTFGTAVAQGETLPDWLESTLRERLPEERIETVNMGIPGAAAYDNMIRIETMGLDLDPDLIVLCFLYNDVRLMDRDLAWLSGRTAFDEDGRAARAHRQLRRRSYFVRYLGSRLAALGRRLNGTTDPLAGWDAIYRERGPAWMNTEDLLLRTRDECAARGCAFALAVLPALVHLTDDAYPLTAYRRTLIGFCDQHAIPVIDLHRPLWGGSTRRYWASPLDPHPSSEGHAILARELADRLIELNLIGNGAGRQSM